MAGPVKWTESNTLKLIGLYKSYEFLWDKKTDLYRNKFARKQAYDAIATEMNTNGTSGLTPADLKCKIKNLRTSYYQELRKMASLRINNRPIRPLRWFLEFKSVMVNETLDSQQQQALEAAEKAAEGGESNSETDIDEEEEDEQIVQEDESYFVEEPTSNSDSYVVSIKQEFLDEMENHGEKSMPPTIGDYLEPASSTPPVLVAQPQQRPKKIAEDVPMKKSKKLDEFQVFANNIARQLRKMPLSRALKMEIDILSMVAKERIDAERIKKRFDTQEDTSYEN